MNIEVTMKNYGKILQYLKPKLKSYLFAWAKEFKQDISDVEEIVYGTLETAIKTFDKESTRKFESYFILLTRNTLINNVRNSNKDNFLSMQFRSNPCDLCSTTCEDKCFRYKMYYRGCLSLNSEEIKNARDFTDTLADQEHKAAVIKTFVKENPKHQLFIENLVNEILAGYIGGHALSRAIKKTARKNNVGCYAVYKKIPDIQKYLQAINERLLTG